jgi:flagellar hook-associated protein 3 FlgL
MRISTNTLYQSGASKLSSLQVEQAKLQVQASTGKRFNSPSEDPVAAARVLDVSHLKDVNTSYATVRTTAKNDLGALESSLVNVTNLMTSIQSSLIAAGNATYSNQERLNIGTELSNSLQSLVGLANGKDVNGNYLFAGYQSQSPAFVATATGINYAGDDNALTLQVDSSRQMEVTANGNDVFLANGNDVFAKLNDIVNLLKTPITDATTQANFTNGLATAIEGMRVGLDNVLNVRSSVGAKLGELDALDTAGLDRDLQYKTSLSDLQDLDYTSALSDFTKNQTIIEAAQKTFTATTQLSLFKFI